MALRVTPSDASPDLGLAMKTCLQDLADAHRALGALRLENEGLARTVAHLREEIAEVGARADQDPLTGLPNRKVFTDRLHQAVLSACRDQARFTVALLDVDAFKSVNDRFGHGAGDRLLQAVAARLTSVIRASDTASRIGGDEFCVLLLDVGDDHGSHAASRKLDAALAGLFADKHHKEHVRVSIGTATFPADGTTGAQLLDHADRAMYRAKPARDASPRATTGWLGLVSQLPLALREGRRLR